MSIQILQYEFLGPIKLDEWGPPMEKVVYLIMSRSKDTFNILYVSDCEKTEDAGFFTKNPNFKPWIDKSGSEKFLYLAIYPMFDSPPEHRKLVVSKIISHYKPLCNVQEIPEDKPDYIIKPQFDSENNPPFSCPCCGSEMKLEKTLEKSSIFKCPECGLSDSKLNS
ncbi:hypothetical protein NsoK4_01945 [Nitrosopumilus sp. K4]|uniref:hypothetical protein n=1 Tax=Nitrosopumilus sp. K4 TaxID=2795383 RepID=UPI001BACA5CC|nr:hypothetical protein [Nitrosopumilus sp. K4]QUC65057.1 hypothetical protein NsoK4_01945 [Nitrosopumilus sp. K4]